MSENLECDSNDQQLLYKKIAEDIYTNRAEHEKTIRELFVKTDICSIDEFYNCYQREVSNLSSETTPTKNCATIADFKNVFSAFDKYPSNLQKSKKTAPKELNRTLASSKTISVAEISSVSLISPPESCVYKQEPTAVEIYNGFKQFKQALNKLLHEIKQEDLETNYVYKLQKLNSFAKDVEKLCGADSQNVKEAFSKEEEIILREFVDNLEKAVFIDANRNIFRDEDYPNQNPNNHSSENMLELLNYWLNLVSHYKEI